MSLIIIVIGEARRVGQVVAREPGARSRCPELLVRE